MGPPNLFSDLMLSPISQYALHRRVTKIHPQYHQGYSGCRPPHPAVVYMSPISITDPELPVLLDPRHQHCSSRLADPSSSYPTEKSRLSWHKHPVPLVSFVGTTQLLQTSLPVGTYRPFHGGISTPPGSPGMAVLLSTWYNFIPPLPQMWKNHYDLGETLESLNLL